MVTRIMNDRGTIFHHVDTGEYGKGKHEVSITKKAMHREMQDMVILIQKEYDLFLELAAQQPNNAQYAAAVVAKEQELQKAYLCLESIANIKVSLS